MTGDDVDAMVEAVLDVLAPQVDGPPGFAAQRWPVIRFDYEGHPVVPDETQLRALAEQIVTAVRTATHPMWRPAGPDGTEERPVRGGLTGVVGPSSREPGLWNWQVVARTPGKVGVDAEAVGQATSCDLAKREVGKWEDANTGRETDDH
jgi:hypothetical protein